MMSFITSIAAACDRLGKIKTSLFALLFCVCSSSFAAPLHDGMPIYDHAIRITCEYYKGKIGVTVISWNENDYTVPTVISESISNSTGGGTASADKFTWDKDLSTFVYDRKEHMLIIYPKDGNKVLKTVCTESEG